MGPPLIPMPTTTKTNLTSDHHLHHQKLSLYKTDTTYTSTCTDKVITNNFFQVDPMNLSVPHLDIHHHPLHRQIHLIPHHPHHPHHPPSQTVRLENNARNDANKKQE